jgi:hypothetical protein
MGYYYTGRDGASFTDATIHTDADCCPDPTRPIAESSIDADTADFCADCATGNTTASDGDDSATDTCDVVKADDEVCGRDLPCPYHSD